MQAPSRRLYEQAWPSGDFCFFQMAWVVDDLIAAASKWVGVYGVGPFHVLPRTTLKGSYRGEPSTLDAQTAVTQVGPVQFELVQQFDDEPSVYRDFFPSGASGFHHICTITNDFEASRSHYIDLGYPAITEFTSKSGRLGYFDTSSDFGVVTEVVEHSPDFVEALGEIARTCASWSGDDPIRLLHRDGYDVPTGEANGETRWPASSDPKG